jgi:hypothetical protein
MLILKGWQINEEMRESFYFLLTGDKAYSMKYSQTMNSNCDLLLRDTAYIRVAVLQRIMLSLSLLPTCRWRQVFLWSFGTQPTRLHGVIPYRTTTWKLSAVKTSDHVSNGFWLRASRRLDSSLGLCAQSCVNTTRLAQSKYSKYSFRKIRVYFQWRDA